MARPSLAISRCTETPTSPRLLLTNVHAPKGQSHQLNIILHAGQEGGQGLVTQDPGPAWKGGPMLRAALGVFPALLQAHSVLGHGAALCTGAKGIVNSSLIPSLVGKLQTEEERIQELLLDTLAACLMEDATEALASRVVPFLKEKLLSANSNIRSKAAQALIAVSIPLEGKNQVWQHDIIPILVHLLKDKEEEVQASAAGALMYVTVTTKGKYAALDTEAIGPLLELLHSPLSKARLNAIKVLTMLAEAPEGRKILQSHVPTFRALKEDTSAAVQRAAQIAVKVIEWKP
ncbi:radial spoke head 14 homolog [Delphinus delphis]|uniref:radial spoke head 14 homolog n=1 Tax=Delphinus delphis TaxID=9728 RepID=UPI0028C470F1|nr:radial spoke head 14 homolog [Delphinus delphis]